MNSSVTLRNAQDFYEENCKTELRDLRESLK